MGRKISVVAKRFLSWRLGPVSTMATPKRNYETSTNIVPSWISFYLTQKVKTFPSESNRILFKTYITLPIFPPFRLYLEGTSATYPQL